ncbi:hypothetical protein, partial [Streptomyces sp. NPDC056948]|uniref:hypothetical protein n=1 Tax=Streptomyces sp. NPDC056948 TaxID=3345975 RepID=UPI003625B0E0
MTRHEVIEAQRVTVEAPDRASAALATAVVAARVCHTGHVTVRVGSDTSAEGTSVLLADGGHEAVTRLAETIDEWGRRGTVRLDVHCDSCREGAGDHRPCRLELPDSGKDGPPTVVHG